MNRKTFLATIAAIVSAPFVGKSKPVPDQFKKVRAAADQLRDLCKDPLVIRFKVKEGLIIAEVKPESQWDSDDLTENWKTLHNAHS